MAEPLQERGAAPSTGAAQQILEVLPEPVLLVRAGEDGAAEIDYGNAAARETFRVELAGAPLGTAIRRPEVLEAVEAALATGESSEVAFETIGVQPRFWRVLTRPLGPGEAVVLLRDETDARRTERMRADFLANASHELRTPLASLAGFIETLRTHARDDVAARDRFLIIMAEQAARMARLIDDLLSLSRIELNEHIPPAGAVDLAATARDVCDALRPLIAAKQIKVRLEDHTASAAVAGDRDQLVQVVQNVVDNAIKYAAQGGVVSVTLEAVDSLQAARMASGTGVSLSLLSPDSGEDIAYVVLRVRDDGPGIARQHLPRLAERFYRVEGQKKGGTGLGLAIVKHVVNRHRGGVAVESAEGEGATFSIYLPAVTMGA